jgi:glutamine synthetase type III
MNSIPNLFGSMVFNDTVMQARLPENIYKALKKTMSQGTHLELDVANVVANAMKDWAVEKGVTHFTHWFQPMTGITAEKHDSDAIYRDTLFCYNKALNEFENNDEPTHSRRQFGNHENTGKRVG